MDERLIDFSTVTVLDASSLLAGPLASGMLGDLGARVIKVESPSGDPLRGYPPFAGDVSLVHKVTNRGKHAITCDLRTSRGQEIFRELAAKVDVVAVNFRPQTLEKWGIDYASLTEKNPRVVFLHVTAFGRTGPNSHRPGFARIAEGFAGLAGITGFANREPVLSGYPIVDAMAGVYGAFAISAALYSREKTGRGALIDLALYEPLLRAMEDLVVGLEPAGSSRERVGNANPYVAPNNLFRSSDGGFVVISASTDSIFRRLAEALGKPELAADPRFVTNQARVQNRAVIEGEIRSFAAAHTSSELLQILDRHDVAAGPILLPQDITRDPHIRERGNLVTIHDEETGQDLRMQAPVPVGAGKIQFPGRELGQDNQSVYGDLLGMSADELECLKRDGIV